MSETRLRGLPFDAPTLAAHRRYAYRFARKRLGNLADAEDVVQEALTRAFVRPPREMKFFRTYVCTIVGRLCLDRARGRRDFVDLDEVRLASDETPATQFERHEAKVTLRKAVGGIRGKKTRQVVTLLIDGATREQAAATCNMSVDTVTGHMHHAMRKLADQRPARVPLARA